jgi:hypothetical protein
MVNATTETVSRVLARFEREGITRSTRDGIWWRMSTGTHALVGASASEPSAGPMVAANAQGQAQNTGVRGGH